MTAKVFPLGSKKRAPVSCTSIMLFWKINSNYLTKKQEEEISQFIKEIRRLMEQAVESPLYMEHPNKNVGPYLV